MADNANTKVVTGKVRLAYVHVWEKWTSDPKQDPKYSVCLMIPKSDTATIDKIKAAFKAAAESEKGRAKLGSSSKEPKTTLKDGDVDVDLEKNPEFAGHYIMTVSSNDRPGVVDKDVNPILDQSEVYSGCYARVSMNAYAYNSGNNKGLTFGLSHIQKLADGDALTGRTRAQDDFDVIDEDVDSLL